MQTFTLPHQHGEDENVAQLQQRLAHVEHFQAIAEVFRQMGDPTRVRIFWLLCHCEECVVNLSALLEMSSPAVSHHLRPLKDSGLIVSRREGKEVYYKASDTIESRLLHHMIEQVMEITCPGSEAREKRLLAAEDGTEQTSSELDAIIRQVHDELLHHMERRVTIEALSRQYHINPTTLKTAFKARYGNSIAAHIKEHRMERAAQLLQTTDQSIAEIAQAVGYDSQSKFAAAFKSYFHTLPKEYRRGAPAKP